MESPAFGCGAFEQEIFDEGVHEDANYGGGLESDDYALPGFGFLQKPSGEYKGYLENAAELDGNLEALEEICLFQTEYVTRQDEVPGTGNRREFGKAFNDAQQYGLKFCQNPGLLKRAGHALSTSCNV